jgi:hypothetical protein
VQLLRTTSDGLEDLTGDGSWVGVGLPEGDPGAPASSSFDLELIGEATGRPIDPASTAVSVDQIFTLEDGREVTSSGVAATLAWFDTAAEATATTISPTTDVVVDVPPAQVSDREVLPFVVGGVAVVVLVALVLLATRRRRRARSAAVAAAPVRPGSGSSSVRIVDGPEPAPSSPEPAADAEKTPPTDAAAAPEPAGGAEALAALDEEFRRFEERIQQLESRTQGSGPGRPGPG